MLKHTFLHIPRVGRATERKLWDAGIRTWNDGLNCTDTRALGSAAMLIRDYLERSQAAWAARDLAFFAERLPASESWRMAPAVASANDLTAPLRVAYLDIETTGMAQAFDSVTVVGVFDGTEVKYFVQGRNLGDLYDEMASYDLVVTFNGKCFDLPFLRAAMPGLPLPAAHIDLRFVFRQLGLRGGLKAIERTTGMARAQDELGRLDGFDAVVLWRLHERGERAALPTLLRYNAEDVVGLKPLLELACQRLVAELPLALTPPAISPRITPDIPYSRELIRKIKGEW